MPDKGTNRGLTTPPRQGCPVPKNLGQVLKYKFLHKKEINIGAKNNGIRYYAYN